MCQEYADFEEVKEWLQISKTLMVV
jgi:hypothetical protein